MNEQEKAALLATGEKKLAFIENCMDESLQEKNFSLVVFLLQKDGGEEKPSSPSLQLGPTPGYQSVLKFFW